MPSQESLLRQISARNISEYVTKIAGFGPRPDGSEEDLACCEYICRTYAHLGFQPQRQRIRVPVIEGMQTLLEVVKPVGKEIVCVPFLRSGLTSEDGLLAELVFVRGAREEDCHGQHIKGKLALVYETRPFEDSLFPVERMKNVVKEGGLGLVFSEARADNWPTVFGLERKIASVPFVGIGYQDFSFLRDLTEEESVTVRMKVHGDLKEGYTENISAQLLGSIAPDQFIILVGSHHETVPGCPGANDNASGIATMFEIARVLRNIRPNHTLLFVANGGEEGGEFGIEEYLTSFSAPLDRIKAVIVLDQVAGADVPLSVKHTRPHSQETLETSGWINGLILKHAEQLGYQINCRNVDIGFADATPFVKANIPASVLTGFWADAWYHTCQDTADKVNANLLKAYAEIVLATILEIDCDSVSKPREKG